MEPKVLAGGMPGAASLLVATDGLRELVVQLPSDFIHPLFGDRRTIGPHHLEDPGATELLRQIGRPGHHVEVNVREPLCLGELRSAVALI